MQAELQETKRQSQEQNAELTTQLQAQQVAFEATQKQIAEMMVIMQSLGQVSGVPVQFSAPPPPTPAATPKYESLLFACALHVCRPSCCCGCRRFLQVLETSPCRGGAAEIFN